MLHSDFQETLTEIAAYFIDVSISGEIAGSEYAVTVRNT
jgi:hypothetical protein